MTIQIAVHNLQVGSKARCDGLIELLTSKQALVDVIKAINFAFQPEDPSVPKMMALQDALPTPVQWLLLLTIAAEATSLSFTNVSGCIWLEIRLILECQMAAFGATRIILNHISQRIEKFTIDPKGYAWHAVSMHYRAHYDEVLSVVHSTSQKEVEVCL